MANHTTQKNGKIEFLRFVFCICIILFHIDYKWFDSSYMLTDSVSLFQHGNIGVEFFFLVTGYLFASHCYKQREAVEPIGKSTIKYMYNRWSSIFPYHMIAFFLTYIGIIITEQLGVKSAIFRLLDGLPNFFLIQRTGIYSKDILTLEWYLSVMLISLFILYPICRKYYDVFTHIIAPIVGVFLIGYLCHTYGMLTGTSAWGNFFARCQIRGFAEICLGAFGFEVARFISKFEFSKTCRIIFTIVENGCYLFALRFICSSWDAKYEAYALYALFIGVCLTFSNVVYGNSLFQNKIVYFLGSITLSMYLIQTFVRPMVGYFCNDLELWIQIILVIIGIILAAACVKFFGDKIYAQMKKWTDKLVKQS